VLQFTNARRAEGAKDGSQSNLITRKGFVCSGWLTLLLGHTRTTQFEKARRAVELLPVTKRCDHRPPYWWQYLALILRMELAEKDLAFRAAKRRGTHPRSFEAMAILRLHPYWEIPPCAADSRASRRSSPLSLRR